MNFQYEWCMPNKWTFDMKPILAFIESELFKHKKVLIPFAGKKRWIAHSGITYIDIEDDRPQPYLLGDCLEILPTLKDKYSLIILDPPFSFFQAVHSYNNIKMQDITRVKQLCDKLLTTNGVMIHCGFNSTGMGKKYGYIKKDLLLVNTGGSHNDFIILKEVKKQKTLV